MEKKQIARDIRQQDPRAYKKFIRLVRDAKKGINYYDSVLKDLEPEFRAEMVLIELSRAKNKRTRYKELRKARVINAQTLKAMKLKGFKREGLN